MLSDLRGRLALVTGAGRRLGRATALALARAGAGVVLHHRTAVAETEALAAEIASSGGRAWPLRADLTDPAQAGVLLACAAAMAGGEIDLLVNNAAIWPEDTLDTLEADAFAETMQINAFIPLALGRDFAARWRGRGTCPSPCIIHLLDSRIVDTDPTHAGYHLSKKALEALLVLQALEYAPAIRVNAVAPGLVLPPPDMSDAAQQRLAAHAPLARIGTAVDVAEAVVFLALSDFITGQILFVDGGRHLGRKAPGKPRPG